MTSRRIILGVSGSIAAFKAAAIATTLVKDGHQLRVVMTAGAERFVTPLTFEALTGQPIGTSLWDGTQHSIGHLELAHWAEVLLIAPASAGVLARVSLGLTDDLLAAVALATSAPLLVAPAMESGMFLHPATQVHLKTLVERGAVVVGPVSGRLASGVEGVGRMSEPDAIVAAVNEVLSLNRDLEGWRVVVTAGPTFEAIDRVRFVGNRSSGKMGYALAMEAAKRGAEVVLISGPTALDAPPDVRLVSVESAREMAAAVRAERDRVDVVVMAAAVADFTPRTVGPGKLRRSSVLTLELVPTEDIAAEMVLAAPNAFHVGFALETTDLQTSARSKLERKGQHLVVGNSVSEEHDPFGSEVNRVVFVTRDGCVELPEMSKREVARRMWDQVVAMREPDAAR